MVPVHHKELAKFLRSRVGEPAQIHSHRDDNEQREVRVGSFGPPDQCFYSTIGICDRAFDVPDGTYEFAAMGGLPWLPNAIVSSVYWLGERSIEHWPLVCEDVVRSNAKSTFRHMVYIPSTFVLDLQGLKIRWLLGTAIKDSELQADNDEVFAKVVDLYPKWLLSVEEQT